MYDIYRKDRKEVNATDYEGSGIGSGYYDEHEENLNRQRSARLPAILILVFTVLIAATIYINVKENYIINNGMTTNANKAGGAWSYYNTIDGMTYGINVRYAGDKNADQIKVYYLYDGEMKATTKTNVLIWIVMYVIFSIIVIACVVWRYLIMHPKTHVKSDGWKKV